MWKLARLTYPGWRPIDPLAVPLAVKFGLFISLLLAAFGVTFTIVSIRDQQAMAQDRRLEQASAIVEILSRVAVGPLLDLDLTELGLLLRDVKLQQGVRYAYITDATGRILVDGSAENPQRDFLLDDEISRAARSATAPLTQWGDDYIEVSEPVYLGPTRLGGVRVGFDMRDLRSDIDQIRIRGIAVAAAFLVFGILCTSVLVATITRPISRLVSATEAVSFGDLERKLEVGAHDELGVLAESFNRMTANLRRTTVSRDYVENILRSMADSVIVLSLDARVLTVNKAGAAILESREEELIDLELTSIMPPESAAHVLSMLSDEPGAAVRNVEGYYLSREGRLIPVAFSATPMRDAQGRLQGVVCVAQDLTERKALEQELTRLAFHDALTGLPNRVLFLDRVEHAFARAERLGSRIGVIFLDLDNFKVVNDSLGHEAGDQLLAEVADRLRVCVRAGDTAARLGGDEFTVLVEGVRSEDDLIEIAGRIASELKAALEIRGHELCVTASMGLAVGVPRHDDPQGLLRNADLAMYSAKRQGKARHAFFDASMNAAALERLELEGDLRHALARHELTVVYQPISTLASGEIVQAEALLRWANPRRGMVSPARFIPIAEETGLIVPIGLWVLEESCREAGGWQLSYPERPPMTVSVNLSARQFQHEGLVADVKRILEETRLAPELLCLEITESVLIDQPDAAAATLRSLKELGVRLAIDDFGTGYSSLSYLQRFPVDTLKIDRSFVDGLGKDAHNTALVRSIVGLARNLGMDVTAEGIETAEQLRQLELLGCDRGQGYYLAKPGPVEALHAMLRRSEGAVLPAA